MLVFQRLIRDLQYRGAKMATKSEMFAKYGHQVYFCEKYKKICTINVL